MSTNGSEEKKTVYTSGVSFKIITAVLFLCAFGLIMIFSASSYSASISSTTNYDSAFYFKKQCVNIFAGTLVMIALCFLNFKFIKKLYWVVYVLAIVSLGLLFTGFAISVNGATRWVVIFGVQIQVADFVRICVIIFMAAIISHNWKLMDNWKFILFVWILVGIQAGAVFLISSNLSSAIILMLMVFTLTFIVSHNWKLHLGALLIIGIGVFIFLMVVKNNLPLESELDNYPYQMRRFFAWMDPERYADSIGYQVLQSLYAIGSGGLLGKGLGNGTQKLINIPEAQNDMIFAIICEELGLIGVAILFIMYGYLLFQMKKVVKESRNLYGSLVVIGVMLHITYQIIVNVFVAVNLFPNTGVSLPFISYGGSAMLFTLGEIGLVLGVRMQQINPKYSKGK